MLSKLKILLSYFVPITLRKYTSEMSGELEINLIEGKKVLDTKTTNYSFGSLQKILVRGLQEIEFDERFNKILLLGLGGGSVVYTLRKQFQSKGTIDAVEIDKKIIEIAIEEFDIYKYGPLQIHHDDAFEFVSKTTETYDLIIVDIFIENKVPEIFTTSEFIKPLSERLVVGGQLIFNIMPEAFTDEQLERFKKCFHESDITIREIKNVLNYNQLLLGVKKNLHLKDAG
ncbi:MAG TPA: fused MFS/spermidine synthase [Flavobacteriaceae bacterium]|nr:fused MFS/spermidine synthase [Flavobacteriaceae bacterium]